MSIEKLVRCRQLTHGVSQSVRWLTITLSTYTHDRCEVEKVASHLKQIDNMFEQWRKSVGEILPTLKQVSCSFDTATWMLGVGADWVLIEAFGQFNEAILAGDGYHIQWKAITSKKEAAKALLDYLTDIDYPSESVAQASAAEFKDAFELLRETATPTDTKTDKGKKTKKKREASGAARVCALHVKKEMTEDPTVSRIQSVKDWCETRNNEWEGKRLSVSGIDKMLQANPELWKPADT